MTSPKDKVTQTFLIYSQTFEKLVAENNPSLILPFFHLPSILIAPEQEPVLMTSEEAVKQVFSQLIKQLTDYGFDHSKLNSLSTKILSEKEGIVSGTATRYKDKEETEILQKFGFTYTLRNTGSEWKIIMGIIHDTETALNFD